MFKFFLEMVERVLSRFFVAAILVLCPGRD
jgi:hypothetical protein